MLRTIISDGGKVAGQTPPARSEAPSQDKVAAYVRDLVRRDQEQAQGYKDTIRQQIADGMASLRAGRTIDGESRMAQRTARLEELERQGR